MTFLYNLVVVLHLLGMAALVGSYLTVVRAPRVLAVMRDAAGVQVVTGLVLVGLVESGAVEHAPLLHGKIGVKTLVAVVILALAVVGARKARSEKAGTATSGPSSTATLAHAIGGLAILNVLVAVLWT